MSRTETITIRHSTGTDTEGLRRLAQRDSTTLRERHYLLAQLGGRTVAALGLEEGSVIADPFTATAELVTLLHEANGEQRRTHRRQLRMAPHGRLARAL